MPMNAQMWGMRRTPMIEKSAQKASQENGWYFLKQMPKLPWNRVASKSTPNAAAISWLLVFVLCLM